MKIPRQAFVITALILGMAAPTIMSVTAYQITKNPAFRPLARSQNDIAIYQGKRIVNEVSAHIIWPTGRDMSFTKPELTQIIRNAFGSHGVNVRIVLTGKPGTGAVTIAYTVGANRFKPQPVQHAADGIKTAVAAYRMYQVQQGAGS